MIIYRGLIAIIDGDSQAMILSNILGIHSIKKFLIQNVLKIHTNLRGVTINLIDMILS